MTFETYTCEECKYDYNSYHCMGCDNFKGSEDDLDPFCNYCEHTPYEDACENCVWNFSI